MSTYTQTVFFTPKDALLTGNPAKLIKGAEVDPELAAIATAIASKYDSSNLFANPSATVGLTNVVGSATTAMRSDAAPPLSQAIVPTWTAIHTFAAGLTSSAGITVNAAARNVASLGQLAQSFGNTTDNPTYSFNGTGATTFGGAVTATGAIAGSNFSGFANPSGTAGLTAVNGSAITAMRSDGAPAISQAIVPTWTGTHTFSGNTLSHSIAGKLSIGAPSSGNALTLTSLAGAGGLIINGGSSASLGIRLQDPGGNGVFIDIDTTNTEGSFRVAGTGASLGLYTGGAARQSISSTGNVTIAAPSSGVAFSATGIASSFAGRFVAPNSAGVSLGLQVQAGTNSLDQAFGVENASAGADLFRVQGDGGVIVGAPTGGNQGPGTLNAGNLYVNGVAVATGTGTTTGTFTGTFTGFAAGNTGTCTWTKTGNTVTLFMPTNLATSNATSFTMTGLPAAIQPATLTQSVSLTGDTQSNGAQALSPNAVITAASGTVTFHTGGGGANWASAGNKGWSVGASITYSVQ